MISSFQEFWSNPNYRIASFIAVAMVFWFATGIFASDTPQVKEPPAGEAAAAKNTNPVAVRAKRIQAEMYPLKVSLKGKTEAKRSVDLRAEVGGQIEAVPVEKGDVVERGDIICQLAVEDRELRVNEAQAAVAQAQIEYDGAQRLKSGGFQSETAIATAKAQLESAKANLLRRQIDLEKTAIRAPFAGVVDRRPAELGALMRVGDTCATLLDLDPLLLTAQVSEQEIANITNGSTINARLITGETLAGEISYVSRSSDDITRTFRIEAEVENSEHRFASGVTAELLAFTGDVSAHLIPASLLVLNDEGELGVRVLDEQNVVHSHEVKLIGDANDGVWVTGLPNAIRLITVGHEYVAVGNKVNVAEADAPQEIQPEAGSTQ